MPLGAFRLNTLARYVAPAATGRTALSLTAYGNAQVDTANRKIGMGSLLCDGSGDYLVVENNSVLSLGDFTVECWFRVTDSSAALIPLVQIGNFLFYIGQDGGPVFAIFQGGSNRLLSSTVTINNNTWYHVAFTRTGSSMTCYFNGTSVGTGTFGTGITQGTNYIGRYSTYYLSGQLDEVRISDTARYTSGFTPSTTAFVNDTNTVLLAHMDGNDGSTLFLDDDGADRAAVGVDALNQAQVDTAQSKFGGASALFDGSGDYLEFVNDGQFTFGTNDFTIEFWMRPNALGGTKIIYDCRNPGAYTSLAPVLYLEGTTLYYYVGAGRIAYTGVSTNTWYHVALSRNGNNHRMFVNGTQAGTTWVNSVSLLCSSTVTIGIHKAFGAGTYDYNGWLDDIRISNVARYTSNFTAPSAAFESDSNTLLLLHCDGTDASTDFIDDNGQTG